MTDVQRRYVLVEILKNVNGSLLDQGDHIQIYDMDYKELGDVMASCADVRDRSLTLDGDIDQDCYVGLSDVTLMADQWLSCSDPADPESCQVIQEVPSYTILPAEVTVDGTLSAAEWDGAEWMNLDQVYSGDPCDLASATFALRWNDTTNMVYAAVIVDDHEHIFENTPTNWNSSDRIEVYSQGDANGGTGWGVDKTYDKAQQYAVGPKPGNVGTWANWGAGDYLNPVTSGLDVASQVDGSVITYEVGVTQYIWNGSQTGAPTVIRDVTIGDIVGFDIIASSKCTGGFGMFSENMFTGKWKRRRSVSVV